MKDDLQRKTTDKGWAAMKQILDREMPEKKKRRLAFWWWLILPGLFLLAWGIRSRAVSGQEHNILPQKHPTVPVAQQHIVPSAAQAPHSNADAPAKARLLPREAYGVVSPNATETVSVLLPAISQVKELVSHTIDNKVLTPNTSTQKPVPTIPVNTLAARSLAARELPALFATPLPLITRHSGNTHWAWGFHVSARTERFKRIDSYGAGMTIEWRPFPRLGIRSGLGYTHTQPSASRVALNAANYLETIDTSNIIITDGGTNQTIGVPEYTNAALPGYIQVPAQYYGQIEAPLMVNWRCWKFLHLRLGGSVAYITRFKTSGIGESGKWILTPANKTVYAQVQQLTLRQIYRWKYDLLAGVALPVNRHFEISFGIKIPFTSGNIRKKSDPALNIQYGADLFHEKDALPPTQPLFNLSATYFL